MSRRRTAGQAVGRTVGLAAGVAVLLAAAACGGGASTAPGTGTATPAGAPTSAPLTSPLTSPPVTPAGTTTPAGSKGGAAPTAPDRRTALAQLQPYLARVDALDATVRRVSAMINADTSSTGVRLRPATRTAIGALQAEVLRTGRALPAGLSASLNRPAVLVFSELASRAAAFYGVGDVSRGTDGWARLQGCLAGGARAAARFPADVAALRSLAAAAPAVAVPPASSRTAAEPLVRTQWIWGREACCASCGGYLADTLVPIVWHTHRTTVNGGSDGTVAGVDFAATYRAAGGWTVVIHAG